MTEQNLLKLAKQGNPKAIAAMLNQSLKSKNITAKVNLKDDCLHVLVESAQLPKQQTLVSFIRKGLIQLEAESIKTVKVYGRQTGEEFPAWNETFEIVSEPETPSSSEEIDIENLSSYQILHQPPRTVSSKEETPSSPRQADRQNLQRSSVRSQNPSPNQPIEPLSIGNVVTTGLVLYRSHLKAYFSVALFANLWIILPLLLIIPLLGFFTSKFLDGSALGLIILLLFVLGFYCFAQYLTHSALISRLCFGELVSKPEGVKEGHNQVKPRLWSFLYMAFLIGVLLIGIYFVLAIPVVILSFLLTWILSFVNPLLSVIVTPLLAIILILGGITWFYSRWLVAEVVLAVEDSRKVVKSINRSWELTKNSGFRVQGVVLIAFLVTLPIMLLISYLPQLLFINVEPNSPAFWIINIITLTLNIAINVLLMPFWQAIKALVYYDLRTRREGLGLQLRDFR